ncbi:MAG: phenylacetate--CoA ligase [Alphaproteobacteria bacterium]|nr:phenylacetate--CoA ligase [Rhodospirillales bacterium]MCW9045409.1 phenylacetate--CoA ligase [Alphaproteobacteria bacterium]
MTKGDNYMFAPELETMPRDQLEELQLGHLQKILQHAYDNVDHYKKAFDEKGVKPEECKTLTDLKNFPFTVKTDLRDAYPFNLFAVPREKLVRIHASSGTTGKPTVVGYTEGDIDRWADLMARSLAASGARPGDILHNAYGYGLFTGGLGAHYGGERLGCSVVPMSGGNSEKQIQLLQDFGAHVLCSTPSYAIALAEYAEKNGIDLKALPLRAAVCGAEPWSQAMREEIQEKMAITAGDIYGLSEIMGPGVACECEDQCGLHGWEDHFLFEIIDPETGEPQPYGTEGELVITTLTKEALPMIRYRTRDITKLTADKCSCGRTHVRILRVTGRNDDMLIIRGVNVYPSQIESVMVGLEGVSPHYQLVVQREGAMDTMTVEVEAEHGVEPSTYDNMGKEIQHHIKSIIGVSTRVVVLAHDELPRSQGKAIRVRDMRKG